jgi:hypothetical protein
MADLQRVGILGGTGAAGRALATRLAAAGVAVVIGSRDAARAEEVAAQIAATGTLRGAHNAEAAACELVVLATPWEGAVATARELAAPLSGKVVVSMVNALSRIGNEFQALVPVRGSMAATVQAAVPAARVTAAFHHLPAGALAALEHPLCADVLVCADDEEAGAATCALVEVIPGLRAVRCGSLASANAVEALTAVLLNVNRRYKAHAALALTGLGEHGQA